MGPFEFPAGLTGDIYADFLDAELPNLLEDNPLVFKQSTTERNFGSTVS
jgi:hypothetical protein